MGKSLRLLMLMRCCGCDFFVYSAMSLPAHLTRLSGYKCAINAVSPAYSCKMKRLFILELLLLSSLCAECLIFKKILHDDEYPGKCFPVHVRVGKKKKYDLFPLEPGEEMSDPNTCGTTVCMNAEGEAYAYFCPQTLPSSECKDANALNTRVNFPECCWNCVSSVECTPDMMFPSYPYPPIKSGETPEGGDNAESEKVLLKSP